MDRLTGISRLRGFLAAQLLAFCAQQAAAISTGIIGFSGKNGINCNNCHSRGRAPVVSFAGPSTMGTRDREAFTFTVESADPDQQTASGFNVAASGGDLFIATGMKEQKDNGELTHTGPRENDASGRVVWKFDWRAPNTPGNYILYGSGNSVNEDNTSSGDLAASTVFFIAVGGVTPLPTLTLTLVPSSTPTRTASPTAIPPTSSATATATTTPSASLSPTPPPPTSTATATASDTPTQPPTPTSTTTATSTPLPSATATASATHTPSETSTAPPTATATSVPTAVQTAGATDTPVPTPPFTATPSATATVSPRETLALETTPSPTAPADPTPGDANCDARVTAADVPGFLAALSSSAPGPCGADVDQSGALDAADLQELARILFAG